MKKTEEDIITEKANYISEMLEKDFMKCYKFVKNNVKLSQ